ncbi:transposase [Candidatus Enterovibrio escicola]|uniref:transposase n=1 Tax=Candidatus Enterovibrio escicola TaxID=1927127 RepID=UPI001CC22FF4|nr:transposase [Candidatus Enterovibrio escacola]
MANQLLGCLYGDKGYISDPFGARIRRHWSDTDNRYEKEYKTKSDETLGSPDAPETVYY